MLETHDDQWWDALGEAIESAVRRGAGMLFVAWLIVTATPATSVAESVGIRPVGPLVEASTQSARLSPYSIPVTKVRRYRSLALSAHMTAGGSSDAGGAAGRIRLALSLSDGLSTYSKILLENDLAGPGPDARLMARLE